MVPLADGSGVLARSTRSVLGCSPQARGTSLREQTPGTCGDQWKERFFHRLHTTDRRSFDRTSSVPRFVLHRHATTETGGGVRRMFVSRRLRDSRHCGAVASCPAATSRSSPHRTNAAERRFASPRGLRPLARESPACHAENQAVNFMAILSSMVLGPLVPIV